MYKKINRRKKGHEPVVISDEIDSNTQMTESTRSANTVQVGLGHFREIEVDDHVDGLDINTTSKQV